MENQFNWKIENFAEFKATRKASQSFFACGYQWKATIWGKRKNVGYMSFFLDAEEDHADVANWWSRSIRFKVEVIDQVCGNNTITVAHEAEDGFGRAPQFHLLKLIHFNELCHADRGYVLNNTCVVRINIAMDKDGVSSGDLIERTQEQDYIPLLEEEEEEEEEDQMEMDVFGKIEHRFIPILKDVFQMHPSLPDFLNNRKSTPEFRGWTCTALSRVLNFLNTHTLREMDQDASNTLGTLWSELETIGFDDLGWLKPHVDSALVGAQEHIHRNFLLKTMRDSAIDIEKKIENRKEEVEKMESALETLKTQLVETENQFMEKDVNEVIGY